MEERDQSKRRCNITSLHQFRFYNNSINIQQTDPRHGQQMNYLAVSCVILFCSLFLPSTPAKYYSSSLESDVLQLGRERGKAHIKVVSAQLAVFAAISFDQYYTRSSGGQLAPGWFVGTKNLLRLVELSQMRLIVWCAMH